MIYNGSPFKDHWAYLVRSHTEDGIGVKIHATGDVRNGFKFEVKRSHDLASTPDIPNKRAPLQWVDAKHFDEGVMLNWGVEKIDERPVCGFEASAYQAKAPGKTLNAPGDKDASGKQVTLENCQYWLVEAAGYLVQDRLFGPEVATYLHAIEQ
ncbi:hypothetical protein BDP55DRAFT_285122 [Colletotrichum godetiae]|uniref:Uncharacterized protein n=1 Tax=Colletotrichum godetiae TaxID=1209918 RepID=A0AAJ0EPN7_9PEZI|nr:uncharacterized protein BDP55DRAFT_285122 [Colletotrichum godetiae]KAK1671886.1 hypothetical protein BDP55DRAFT_285122 [Colletotrichum godetiae]